MLVIYWLHFVIAIAIAPTGAQSKHDRFAAKARQAASTPTSTGPLRRAVERGSRRATQQAKSYQYYFDLCMAR